MELIQLMLCPEPLQRTTLLFDQSSHHRSRALTDVKRSQTFLKVEPTGWPSSLSLSLSLFLFLSISGTFLLSLFLSHARACTSSHTHARTCDGGFFEANLDKSCCSQMAFLHNRELFHWLWNVFAGNGFIALLKKTTPGDFFGEKVCVQLQPFWVKQLLLKFWTIFVNDGRFKVCVGDNFSPASSERSLCGGGKAPPIQKRYRDFLKNLTEQQHYSSLVMIMNQNVWYNDYHWCR